MAGIYIHIPFCRQKCHYCNFFSVASGKYRDVFLHILKKEIFLQKDYLKGQSVSTIYFGGGTPSLLPVSEIEDILQEIKKHHRITPDAEITLEANPDDMIPGKADEYRNAGINRLSIGIQSFFDDDLNYLNRIHSGKRAVEVVKEAQQAGFSNISIDLIYGIPGLTEDKWRSNLKTALLLDVPHISAYALTVEEGTPLEVMIRKGKMKPVDDAQAAADFQILMKTLKDKGFMHYEISNFAKEGYFSQHNCHYWDGTHYLGSGPSAHSFDGSSRQWNISNLSIYIDKIKKEEIFYEKEILSKIQCFNEYVMVSLRTMWGCDIAKIINDFGSVAAGHLQKNSRKFIDDGKMIEEDGFYKLTDEGKFFADGIASSLFLEPEDGSER